ncbi:hypothetical protein B0H14DRAFT_2637279 [Mycena olivaceomarginata]|nr:hypothetical protein B0H14DRAFT_2637279 [Mycena olivaceomarginata]
MYYHPRFLRQRERDTGHGSKSTRNAPVYPRPLPQDIYRQNSSVRTTQQRGAAPHPPSAVTQYLNWNPLRNQMKGRKERGRALRLVHGHRMALARIRSFVNIQRWRTADYTSRGAARAEGSRRQETLPPGTESRVPIGFQLSARPTVRPLEMSKYRRSRKSKLSFPAHLRVRPNPKPGKTSESPMPRSSGELMGDRREDAWSDNLSGVETGAVRKQWPDPCLTWLARAPGGAARSIPSICHRASRRSVGRSYKRKREKKHCFHIYAENVKKRIEKQLQDQPLAHAFVIGFETARKSDGVEVSGG